MMVMLYLHQPNIIICTLPHPPPHNYPKSGLPSTSQHHLKHMSSSTSSSPSSARPSFPPSPASRPSHLLEAPLIRIETDRKRCACVPRSRRHPLNSLLGGFSRSVIPFINWLRTPKVPFARGGPLKTSRLSMSATAIASGTPWEGRESCLGRASAEWVSSFMSPMDSLSLPTARRTMSPSCRPITRRRGWKMGTLPCRLMARRRGIKWRIAKRALGWGRRWR